MKRSLEGLAAFILSSTALMAEAETQTMQYECDRGAVVVASYVNSTDSSDVVLQVEGQTVALNAGPTGSGVRYSDGSADGYVWHTKGDEAVLFWQSAGEQSVVYQACQRQ